MPDPSGYRRTYRVFRELEWGTGMTGTTDDDTTPAGAGDGVLDTSRGHLDPAGFEDGDDIDSAAIVDDPADYQQPAEPAAEPDDEPDGPA
jgi:hypothetical protein